MTYAVDALPWAGTGLVRGRGERDALHTHPADLGWSRSPCWAGLVTSAMGVLWRSGGPAQQPPLFAEHTLGHTRAHTQPAS